jgi:MoaA/NifB/PqqE/SkfB family radical SAM enzyme
MPKITSVCWDISSKCNDTCKFCFRDSTSIDLSLAENMYILNKFIDYGINKITFTGGEATLYDSLWDLIQYAHNNNIFTNMVTNALAIKDDFFSNMEKHLDCITLSLDGPNSVIQNSMTRNEKHFDNIMNVLKTIDKRRIVIKKKVNTLVTGINIDYITNILPIMYEYKIDVWKLFQFIYPRYMAKLNKKIFYITDSDFFRLKEEILARNRGKSMKILFLAEQELKTSYFVVSSNGNVRYDGNKESSIIGNLLSENIDDIFKKVNFNYNDYRKRIEDFHRVKTS